MSILNIIVGSILGFGAGQELVERGILGRELQPAILGTIGVAASVLLILSGVAMLRGWPNAFALTVAAALLTIAMHVYGVLPPHHNVGMAAFLLGAGYGIALLVIATLRRRRQVLHAR